MTAEENGHRSPRLNCSEPHHRFHFLGRSQPRVGPPWRAGRLMWQSAYHAPSATGAVRHWIAIDPDDFWRKPTDGTAP